MWHFELDAKSCMERWTLFLNAARMQSAVCLKMWFSLMIPPRMLKMCVRTFKIKTEWAFRQPIAESASQSRHSWCFLPLASGFFPLKAKWERPALMAHFCWGWKDTAGLVSHSACTWGHSHSHKGNSGSHPDNTFPAMYKLLHDQLLRAQKKEMV